MVNADIEIKEQRKRSESVGHFYNIIGIMQRFLRTLIEPTEYRLELYKI